MDLQTIWFFLWGLIWALFFITGGYDLGLGSLYPFLGKTEMDKRTIINAKGPLWDGNQVWLLTAGGVTFAAFPQVYATMFSSLYAALMLILFALIIRGVSFEFRHQLQAPLWTKVWDTCIFIGSIAPAILFGVAFANIFQGIPFDEQGIYQGTLFTLLNPYGLLGGVLFLLLFMQHGALWLAIRTTGDLHDRAVGTAKILWPVLLGVAVLFLIASWFATNLYANYLAYPAFFLVIVLAVAGLLGAKLFVAKQAYFKAWFASALTIIGCTFFGVVGLFPSLFPSSIDPGFNLTAFNASSSPVTLKIMLIVVLLFVPIVLAYQIWAYNLFKTKVIKEDMVY
jgi:cytochrome d ubiquinol oxidase subunit II